MSYNTAAIRELLIDAYGDEDLHIFCYDHFKEVSRDFTTGQSQRARVQQLIIYVDQHGQIEKLLRLVKEDRPDKYANFEARLLVVPESAPPTSPEAGWPERGLGQRRSQEAGQSLALLSEFMRTPEVKEAVVVFQNDFAAASQQIAVMSAYKELHDKLHALQYCHNLIVVEAERFPQDEAARANLEEHELTLQETVQVIQQVAERNGFTQVEIIWLQRDLQQAWQELQTAINKDDQPGLKKAARQLDRALGKYPAQINTRLNEAAKGLPLLSLVKAMTIIRDKLSSLAFDQEKVDQFASGVESLASLNQQLNALLSEHDCWQLADSEWRPIRLDSGQIFEDLEYCWPRLKQLTEPFYGTNTEPWATSFKTHCERLESALAEQAPQQLLECFRRYRRAASNRFYEVDTNLKKLCEHLQGVGTPLVSVLRVIE